MAMRSGSVLLVLVAILTLGIGAEAASARPHSFRPYYGGGHHTRSHGGHYAGGRGSSHRGGHYRNPRTGDHYGRHRR